MATSRLPTEDRRAQITAAALRLIARHGIASLTTARVAAAVGLTTGALFRHFASLDAILESVADQVAALLRSTHPPSELPPLERLAWFFEARVALGTERSEIPRLVLSEQFSHALPPRAQRELRAAVRETHALLEAIFRDAQRAGEVRDDVEPEALAMIVMGALQMLVLQTQLRWRGVEGARALRASLWRLVEPPGAPAEPPTKKQRKGKGR